MATFIIIKKASQKIGKDKINQIRSSKYDQPL